MRAGRAIRAQAAIMNAPACESCGHKDAHRELLQPTLELADGQIVSTPHPDYTPLVFHCTREGCDCVKDLRP